MVDGPEGLALPALRHIDTKLDRLIEDNLEIKTRLSISEQQYAPISRRVDRIKLRLERIETRLNLVEA